MTTPPLPIAPVGLSVQAGGDSFATTSETPELSWLIPLPLRAQDRFDIEALIDGETVDHSASTGRHRLVPWPWAALASGQSVQWRVRLHSEGVVTDWSEWAGFEAGLFEEDWAAAWISAPEGDDLAVGTRPAYQFWTELQVHQTPRRARLYAAALGVYEAHINGVRVGRTELAPGSESYDSTLYAQAYDVSHLLRPGANSVCLTLSDGWYRGRAGAFRQQAAWGSRTAVRAELHLLGDKGPAVVAATDLSWDVYDSQIVTADLMDGQRTDLTRQVRRLGSAVLGPRDVPAVSWSPAPPVRIVEQREPVALHRLSPGSFIVDFGQNASGRVTLRSLGDAGSRTVLDFGEHLTSEGELTLSHLDSPAPDGSIVPFVQRDEVISDGRPDATFEPHHTLHGFRYAYVSRDDLHLEPGDITMQVLHSDLPPAGDFACSDPDLDALYRVAEWSFRGNAVDVPTDCPTRERAGWTGDYQIFLPTAVRLYDVNGFSRKWLQSVRDDQLPDGRIVNISPDNARLDIVPDPMTEMATGSAGWGDAVVLVPWELYRTYGDDKVLQDTWSAMVRWAEFALRAAAENRHPSRIERSSEPLPHESFIWDGTFHFGEWLEPTPLNEDGTPGPTMPDPMAWAMADKGEVGTAYLYRSVDTLSRIARVLGKHEDAGKYADTAGRIRTAWQSEFLTAEGEVTTGKQAGYVRALAFGLAPDELRLAVARNLVRLIEQADNHLATGFLSTADLLPVLADAGYPEVAHALLLQRTTPSWLGMLDRGATTIWEEWEGVDVNGRASASLNHYSKGAVIRYLQTHTLGLRQAPESVAWEEFVVAPVIADHLTWAEGYFDSPQGRIAVRWEIDGEDAVLRVTVPGGASARLLWAGSQEMVGPGDHEIRGRGTRARYGR